MKKVILLLLISLSCSAQIQRIDHNEVYKKDINGNTYVYKTEVDTVIVQPDWTGLKNDLYKSPLFSYAIANANPNAFSSLLKCLSDGEQGNAKPTTFLYLLGLCNLNFTDNQKSDFNAIFLKNNFDLKLQ